MKHSIPIMIFLGLTNCCLGQIEGNTEHSNLTVKTFHNYLLKKDQEELSLNCQKDTVAHSKDSILIAYHRSDKTIFKTLELYYYTGYLINVHEDKDSFIFSNLIKDTSVVEQIHIKYYAPLGDIVFGLSKNFVRSARYDYPCEGCVTVYLTDKPDETYKRCIYTSSNKLLVEIYYQNSGDDIGYKKVSYSYDSEGKYIDKKEEKIAINQFWEK